MRQLFTVLVMFLALTQVAHAESVTCEWWSVDGVHNFDGGNTKNTLAACSLFIRAQLLGADAGLFGVLIRAMTGKDSLGTLTFTEPGGHKRVCKTHVKKNPPDSLSRAEVEAAYLESELEGGALSPGDKVKANAMLQGLGIDVRALEKKVDESLALECFDALS